MARVLPLAALLLIMVTATAAVAGGLADEVAALRRGCGNIAGPSPRLDTVKHRLRDWIEGELTQVPADVDVAALEQRLRHSLPAPPGDRACANGDEGDTLGTLGLSLRRQGPALELRTSIGIPCASDESAYLYHWDGQRWLRYWQAEQKAADPRRYRPRTLVDVIAAPGDGLVLATGVERWCSSNWHQVYYQIWRAAPGTAQRLIHDGSDFAFLDEGTGPLEARLEHGEAHVEYTVASIDSGQHSRPALRRLKIGADTAQRVEPLALDPLNFIEEWLTAPWRHSAWMTEPSARETARQWFEATRDRRTGGVLAAEFSDGENAHALRCKSDHSLWQVAVGFPEARPSRRHAWFLVRWQEPYRFRVAAIAARPWSNCTDDADPDGRLRRLLPIDY